MTVIHDNIDNDVVYDSLSEDDKPCTLGLQVNIDMDVHGRTARSDFAEVHMPECALAPRRPFSHK